MAKESLDEKMRNMQPRFTEAEIEQIASDPDKYTDLVSQITHIEGKILIAGIHGLPISQDQHDELDRLVKKAWKVDELQKDN